MSHVRALLTLSCVIFLLTSVVTATACGGLFCQNIPVDQQSERIIFTVNKDNTITAYVQINYTGSAPDFSWVVPVPSVPKVDVAEKTSFDELSNLTSPIFIPPLMPECAAIPVPMVALAGGSVDDSSVQVLASGVAGPYAYDVITSEFPTELIIWLRTNNYRITEEMEPLIKVYTDEKMVFLAMKLRPEKGAQDIQPVVMTYAGTHPMIPLRLTAVAANPNMNVVTWILGDGQAVSTNYAHPTINDDDLRYSFGSSDGTNYLSLVDQTVDLYNGRAFITEYAMPTRELEQQVSDPLVKKLLATNPYITRVFGRISPEEMTVDPTFILQSDLINVSNVRDLSKMDAKTFWSCEGTDQNVQVEYEAWAVPEGFK
ncbi:MAG: DUF2330 domain-containing protein [Anaerolineae bacterium]